MGYDVDPNADGQAEPVSVKQCRFEQDTGQFGAVGQNVVRPFQLKPVSTLAAAAIGSYSDAPVRHDGVESVCQRSA